MSDIEARRPTSAVQLTPAGRGAVATVLVDGPRALEIVSTLFAPRGDRPLSTDPPGTIRYGRWGRSAGEDVVVVPLAADRLEVHCHGGLAAPAAFLEALAAAGCQILSWPQWVAQNGESMLAGEALVALANAPTEHTARILLDQFQGALARECADIQASLARGSLASAGSQLSELLERSHWGLHLTEPWRVVLAGPPNVGKSSLINALVGHNRAIVHDAPGTTRDVVTAATALGGWPIELADTAGLRSSDDPLESTGIDLATARMATADACVLVFDIRSPWDAATRELIARWPAAIIVLNKADLAAAAAGTPAMALVTSAVTGQGLEDLQRAILERLVPRPPDAGQAVPFTRRQVDCLRAAQASVGRGDAATALNWLERLQDGGC